ncbi:MAG: hypothetical protein HOC71_00195 [Candidatus Latescibacteria bacterium]|nr:hypothetical protein [Candidatus Latescibacterota bacterium]
MLENSLAGWLLSLTNLAVITGAEIYIRSTIIITMGLCASYALRNKGAAVQSVILRFFLVAVLLSPILSFFIDFTDVPGLRCKIPVVSFNHLTLPGVSLKNDYNTSKETTIPFSIQTRPQKSFAFEGNVAAQYSPNENRTGNINKPPIHPVKIENIPDDSHNFVISPMPGNIAGEVVIKSNSPRVISLNSTATVTKSQNWLAVICTILILLWIVFSLFFFLKLIAANLYILYIRHSAFEAKSSFVDTCNSIARKLVVKAPSVLQSHSIQSPIQAGFFNPFILLPLGGHESSLAVGEIFLHELSHLKRRDYIWNQLRQIGTIVLPFQPLMWILSHWIEETADYACDDCVMKYTGSHRSYAASLLAFSQHFQPVKQELAAGVGFISFKSPLRRRIIRILDKSHTLSIEVGGRFILCLSFLCFIVTCISGLVGFQGTNIVTNSIASEIIPAEETAYNNPDELPMTEFHPQFPPETDKLKKNRTLAKRTENENAFQPDTGKDKNKYAAIPGTTTPLSNIERTSSEVKQLTDIAGDKNHSDSFATHSSLNNEAAQSGKSELKPGEDNPSDPSEETHTDITSYADMDLTESSDPEEISENFTITSEHEEKAAFPSVTDTGEALNEGMGETGFFADASGSGMLDISNYGAEIPIIREDKIKIPFPKQMHLTADRLSEDIDIIIQREKKQRIIYHGLDRDKNEPVWSPDGKWIAFTDYSRIWIVSTIGGEPKLIFENFHEDIPAGKVGSLCFTPDSREIIFMREIFDKKRGSFIRSRWNKNKYIYTLHNPMPTIESINIYTGESNTIVEEGYNCTLGKSGRYLCYLKFDSKMYSNPSETDHLGLPVIYDMETSRTWYLTDDEEFIFGRPTFSPDESHIIASVRKRESSQQLSRISLEGGEPEQLTFFNKNESQGRYRLLPEYSPDGKWILYTDFTWVENLPDKRLFLLYIPSGEIFEFSKNTEGPNSYGKWSHDGKQICYLSQKEDGNYVYICDFKPDAYKSAGSATVNDSEPERFKLYNNFPNPFNPSTTIKFYLPETGFANLSIYNITGQKVRELVSEYMTSGDQNIIWDGRDDNGVRVSSGKYVSLLQMGKKSATGTMTLMK